MQNQSQFAEQPASEPTAPVPLEPLTRPRISHAYADLLVPGVVVEVNQTDADELGAFEEDALTQAEAWDANADIAGGHDGKDK